MPRKKKLTTSWNLVSAIEKIWTLAHNSELNETFFKEAEEPANYVKGILGVSAFQSMVLGVLTDHEDSLTMRNIAHFLNCSKLRVMTFEPEFEDLVKRHLIKKTSTYDQGELRPAYIINKETIKAIKENREVKPYDPKSLSPRQVIKGMEDILLLLDADSSQYDTLVRSLKEQLAEAQHIEFCKRLLDMKLSSRELVFILLVLKCYVCDNQAYIDKSDYEDCFEDEVLVDILLDELNSKESVLTSKKIIENRIIEGIASTEEFCLTEEAINDYFKELSIHTKSDVHMDLMDYEKIIEKPLFYNKREESQITCLASLLDETQFKGIQQRLRDSRMRMGFACLFYGAPGTGKTESCLQLAKQTHRKIMQVNVSEIKSKWVGDSEKNIQQLFNQYRRMVEISRKNNENVPILLFNEADAIISKRKTGAENAVDKMENSIQNIILQEIEKLDGILIATTNLTQNLDSAFERRFLYKIRFDQPEASVKAKIWQSMIDGLASEDAIRLANCYDFSGGQIENIARKQTINNILYNSSNNVNELDKLCKEELIAKTEKVERTKVGFAV